MLNLELVGVTAGLENVNDSWDGRCKLKLVSVKNGFFFPPFFFDPQLARID